MKSLENKKIREELAQIKNRILEKQKNYVKEYCTEAPSELKKEIMEIMLTINQEVSISEFMTKDTMYYFKAFAPELDMENIVKKVNEGVDKLKVNYYPDLVYVFRYYLCQLFPKIVYNNPLGEKYNELYNCLYPKKYTQSHKEYEKINKIISLCEECRTFSVNKINFNVLELIEMLLQYEACLEHILKVEDINLKRAVFSYIDKEIKFNYI